MNDICLRHDEGQSWQQIHDAYGGFGPNGEETTVNAFKKAYKRYGKFRPIDSRVPELDPNDVTLDKKIDSIVALKELIDASTRVLTPIFNPLAWQAFLMLLIGGGLLAMGFILRMRRLGESSN